MRLPERIVRLHDALDAAAIPHAIGGAISLAYCTRDPRGTDDIDVNVFVGVRRLDDVLRALPSGITVTDANRRHLLRDAQARVFWDDTPVDLFLANHPFHGRSQQRAVSRPFEGREIPMLSCIDLAVYKTFFARPQDAVDIAEMVKAGCIELEALQREVRDLITDERDDFLELVHRFSGEPDGPRAHL